MNNKGKTYPIILILVIVAMLLLGTIALLVVNRAEFSREELPYFGQVEDFEFTDRYGQPFGLDDMLGKINLVMFGFTNCKSVCPTTTGSMKQLYELYDSPGGHKVQIVFFSVDPARDTLEQLQKYALSLGVDDNRWKFIRAPVDSIRWMSEDIFMLAAEELPMGHTSLFALVDPEGNIRQYYEGMREESIPKMNEHVRQLAKEMP